MSKEIIYSFKEYQEKYPLMLGDFCKNTEFDEIDFITTEIDYYRIYITSVSMYKRIRYRCPNDPFLDEDTIFLNMNCASHDIIVNAIFAETKKVGINNLDNIIARYKIHFNKIISFLVNKKLTLETPSTDSDRFTKIDLSNSSAVQKIIYLNELGIIDLLKKEPCFKASVNNLATVLSAITGENIKTLQPILNPMFSKNTAQKNNPYSSKSTVIKVKSQLINLGIQSK